ncbi:glycosyltransferase family 4 protein [Deinococcus sp. YIM 77859]|uniref:glycosyltransferase family 4 protein n=1 Tax=Deinococcus sp. YIM 77859 TaxID=1540221 RepID=UPI00068EA0BE|nr:glycosyltransferase family 4 protein [Deinococcus sp. YIM 77859]
MSARNLPVRSLFLDRGLNFHGGVTKALLNLARSVQPEQVQLEIGSLEPPSPEMRDEFGRLGVPVHHLGEGYLRSALALRRVLRASSTQLVVCNSFRSYLIAKLAAAGLPVRLLFWVHGIAEIRASRLKTQLYRALSYRDTLIFISDAVRQANLPPRHAGRHHVIHHGVESPFQVAQWRPYSREARAGLGLAPDDLVLMYVASFESYKDHRTLLQAFDRLWTRHPHLRLVLIGQGVGLEAMRELAASLASRGRIHFLGPRADARPLLGLADIYVHPCYVEGFGLAVVEAMLARLPVVAAAGGGLPEIVQDGVTGLLFPPQSVEDLERQLERLITDPQLARRLGEAGEQRGLQQFSPERFADQMTHVLLSEVRRERAPLPVAGHP